MVDVFKGKLSFSVLETNNRYSLSQWSGIAKVHKVPMGQLIFIRDSLMNIRLTITIHASVRISGKVKHATLTGSNPGSQIAIS
jgi:hypothetical protein